MSRPIADWMQWTEENWLRESRLRESKRPVYFAYDENTKQRWPVGTPEWRKRRPIWEERGA